MYTNSTNYGGLLQAYALCKVLEGLGYEAEQIRFQSMGRMDSAKKMDMVRNRSFRDIRKLIRISIRAKYRAVVKKLFFSKINDRRQMAFSAFRESIPHSEEIYSTKTIDRAEECYDFFAAGSDQIWFPGGYEPAYYLEFVKNKPKFSYAASMAVDMLSAEEQEQYRERLKDFIGVSVREASGVDALKDVSPVPVRHVLDPTLLLSAEQWDTVCAERLISENYVFCYYLGDDAEAREITTQFAKQNGKTVVTIPYLTGEYRKCDRHFGDIKLYDVSPPQFLSLIKHADYVFTDSFHATVFSIIYNCPFFTFERRGHTNMNTRIVSLLNMVQASARFCNSEEMRTVDYLLQCDKMPLTQEGTLLAEMKQKSLNYLTATLLKAEESEAAS